MAITNGHQSNRTRVLILGNSYVSTSISDALQKSPDTEIHVACQYLPPDYQKHYDHDHNHQNHNHNHNHDHTTQSLHYHQCDFTPSSLSSIFASLKPRIVMSTVLGSSFQTQRSIIDTAISCQVPKFIACEFGHDSLNPAVQERLPPYLERAKTITYLEKQGTKGKNEEEGFEWVAVAMGITLDRGLLNGNLGFDLKWHSATLHGKGDEKFAASSTAFIGRIVASVLSHWSQCKNRYLYAAGVITTANEVVQALEKTTGMIWDVGRNEVEDCVKEAERRMERGFPDAAMFLMERSVMYDEGLGAAVKFKEEDVKGLLGLEGEDVGDLVRGVVKEFGKSGKQGGCGCD